MFLELWHFRIFAVVYAVFYVLALSTYRHYKVRKQVVTKTFADEHTQIAKLYAFHGLKYAIGGQLVWLFAFAIFPTIYHWLGGLTWFANFSATVWQARLTALGMVASVVWTFWAQENLGNAWKFGVDENKQTQLVTSGLFAHSRNPIFLGLRINSLFCFLFLPCTLTAAIWIANELFLQIQVRMEEDYLRETVGQVYLDYCKRVRRWI
ncbi:MAG TPA: isoprenylcysteine carboxylmethyltransferase family protein [Anaerolineales bacterium]|nr:isoprenylcysteine carboxylmethyltransferase family protein [Anaerolineales bacterium]